MITKLPNYSVLYGGFTIIKIKSSYFDRSKCSLRVGQRAYFGRSKRSQRSK